MQKVWGDRCRVFFFQVPFLAPCSFCRGHFVGTFRGSMDGHAQRLEGRACHVCWEHASSTGCSEAPTRRDSFLPTPWIIGDRTFLHTVLFQMTLPCTALPFATLPCPCSHSDTSPPPTDPTISFTSYPLLSCPVLHILNFVSCLTAGVLVHASCPSVTLSAVFWFVRRVCARHVLMRGTVFAASCTNLTGSSAMAQGVKNMPQLLSLTVLRWSPLLVRSVPELVLGSSVSVQKDRAAQQQGTLGR